MAGNATSPNKCKRADDGNSCHWVIKYGSKGDFSYPRTFFFVLGDSGSEHQTQKGKNNLCEPTCVRADKAKRIKKKEITLNKNGEFILLLCTLLLQWNIIRASFENWIF